MSVIRRIFRRLSIHFSKITPTRPIFMNVMMTDVRQASVQQKMKSFYRIIDCCLRDGRCVNVVVVLGKKEIENTRLIYSNCLSDYLKLDEFNLVFIKPVTWRAGRLPVMIYVLIYFLRLRGNLASRFNFACVSALARIRLNTFQDIYDALPCSNWLGLTGGVELPALKYRRDAVGDRSLISALQFGQASVEQRHFSGYSVDNLFVYDDFSENVFRQLDMRVGNLLVSGSPEFEYHAGLLCNQKLLDEQCLSIVFVDQPVHQRGEYSGEYLQACHALLTELNADPALNVKVKPHPRGSAFESMPLTGVSVAEDWSDCLSRAHAVIGFFSNLCDLALRSGRVTFYIGSEVILGEEKCAWISGQGGFIVNDIDFVRQEILRLKKSHAKIACQIALLSDSPSSLPSEVIYKKMVACSETQTVA